MRFHSLPALLLAPMLFAACSDNGGIDSVHRPGNDGSTLQTAPSAPDPSTDSAAPDAATDRFVREAASSNQFEIRSSQIALERSGNEPVREFARQMIDDHQKARQELATAITGSRAQEVDQTALTSRHAGLIEELEGAGEAQFDAVYLNLQRQAHEEAVTLFSQYAQNGQETDIKDIAARQLPTLEQHLEHVRSLQQARGGSTTPSD